MFNRFIAAILAFLLNISTAPALADDLYTYEWFISPRSMVSVVPTNNPEFAVYHEEYTGGIGWFYEFTIEENAGVPFTADAVHLYIFCSDGNTVVEKFDNPAIFWENALISRDNPAHFTGGFPLQDVDAVGLLIMGHDENGHYQEFYGACDLIKYTADKYAVMHAAGEFD